MLNFAPFRSRIHPKRSLRAALRPLPLSVGVDLGVVGEEDASRDGTGTTPCKLCLD